MGTGSIRESRWEKQAAPEEAIQEQTAETDFRTMADTNTLEKLLQREAARRAAEQAGDPSTGLGGPAWPHTGTGATGPTPAGGAMHAASGQGYTPQGGTGFSPWHIGPAGNMMPPTGTSTPYGTPGHGQQWHYAQSYPGPPGYYPPQYQFQPGYFPGQLQPPRGWKTRPHTIRGPRCQPTSPRGRRSGNPTQDRIRRSADHPG